MSSSVETLFNSISELSVADLVKLVKMIEEKFEVSAAAAVAVAAAPSGAGAAEAVEEKTEFDVVLKDFGANKVAVIKAARELTGLGLKEAKDLVESAPAPIKTGIAKKDAEAAKKTLEEAGATVEIK